MAHELRTPLARIRVALDLAEDGNQDAARASLGEIAQDFAELERLVDDVLATAPMDLAADIATPGTPRLHASPLDPAQVVRGAVERLHHRHPARPVEVELEPALPPVNTDAVLLRRALDNLLDNARRYGREGTAARSSPRARRAWARR